MADPERLVPAGAGGGTGAAVTGETAESARPQPTWGMPDAAVGWFLAQVGATITFIIVLAATGEDADDLALGWIALGQTGLWLTFLLVPLVVSRLKGNGLVADFGLRAKWVDLAGIPAGFGLQFAVAIALFLFYAPIMKFTDLTWDDITRPVDELTDKANSPFSVAMLVLIVGIGAPVFEEIFYRGLVLRSVEKRFGAAWGVAVSGVVFGVSHFNFQIPGLILFGVVVGVLTVRTGRLGPAIAVHVGFNMIAVLSQLA